MGSASALPSDCLAATATPLTQCFRKLCVQIIIELVSGTDSECACTGCSPLGQKGVTCCFAMAYRLRLLLQGDSHL